MNSHTECTLLLIDLRSPDFALSIDPQTGGSVALAKWKGEPILDRRAGNSVLDMACFPLVPFSNRIAGSAFVFDGRRVTLSPNHPGDPDSPAIHGFGWLRAWSVERVDEQTATLSLTHEAGDWPWDFAASMTYRVSENGFEAALGITNLSDETMPAGLGFHPYFPRTDQTMFHALHAGEWQTDSTYLPTHLDKREQAQDWWDGQSVGTRNVDTIYTAREGDMEVRWPDRGIGARLSPSDDLSFTTVYVPEGESYFCAEPVSHVTDAFNRDLSDNGMRVLAPGESWTVSTRIEAFAL